MIVGLAFVFGLIVGSFLNVLIFRLKSGESVVWSRSHCTHCHKELSAWDLIPLLSFIFLQGRCRYCHAKLSWQYPIVELVTGISFALLISTHYSLLTTHLFFSAIFICFFIVIAVYDFKHYLILDKVVLPGLVLSLAYNIFTGNFFSGILSGLLVAAFFLSQYIISNGRWIGFGDVKLGLFLGSVASALPMAAVLLMIAYFSGSIVGIILLALGQKNLTSKLPFGTFLGFSGIIVILYGQRILGWYMGLIGL